MRRFLEEYGMFLVYFVLALFLAAGLNTYTYDYQPLKEQVPEVKSVSAGNNQDLAGRELPTLTVRSSILQKGTAFHPLDYVTQATDSTGKDLKDRVAVYDAELVNVNKKGAYTVTYAVRDDTGLAARLEATFLVD